MMPEFLILMTVFIVALIIVGRLNFGQKRKNTVASNFPKECKKESLDDGLNDELQESDQDNKELGRSKYDDTTNYIKINYAVCNENTTHKEVLPIRGEIESIKNEVTSNGNITQDIIENENIKHNTIGNDKLENSDTELNGDNTLNYPIEEAIDNKMDESTNYGNTNENINVPGKQHENEDDKHTQCDNVCVTIDKYHTENEDINIDKETTINKEEIRRIISEDVVDTITETDECNEPNYTNEEVTEKRTNECIIADSYTVSESKILSMDGNTLVDTSKDLKTEDDSTKENHEEEIDIMEEADVSEMKDGIENEGDEGHNKIDISGANPRIFENLNDNQKKAVVTTEGMIRVVAGAGSGKTRVLVNRYAYLVEEVGIDPANILCMTFTNKAAQEMKSRIAGLVHRGNVNDFVCTIHGFCVKLLRKEIYRIGYPRNFLIIDEPDERSLAKQVFEEMGFTREDMTIKDFLDSVRIFKVQVDNKGKDYIERYILPRARRLKKDDNNPFVKYIRLQLKCFALDFYDIIAFAIYILQNFDDAREYWQNELNYIQVDEVQDCNRSDWTLVKILSQKHGNLFIVGDPDQAIYEWRGARPELFVKFNPDVDIVLNENYRSTPNILNVANSVIDHNKNRIKKDLFTSIPKGRIAVYFHGRTEDEEAEWIVKQIENIVEAGGDLGDVAILYRSKNVTRSLEQALTRNKINYIVWGGTRFFERKEIRDSIAYLRLIAYNDDLSFERIVNTPRRGFGDVSLKTLREIAKSSNISMYEALRIHKNDAIFKKNSLHEFIDMIDEFRKEKDNTSISDLLEKVLLKSGLKKEIREDGNEERLENLAELIGSMKYYEEVNSDNDISLETYLQDIALYTNADYKRDESSVKLMTIHQAKGLEFPYVFVYYLTEGELPNHRSIRQGKKRALEEERRLMYVAITRAKKMLFLTESEGFSTVLRMSKFPSRFLMEIKKRLIKVSGNLDKELFERTKMMVKELDDEISDGEQEFEEGNIVVHKIFGEGIIIKQKGETGCYKVKFGDISRDIRGSVLELKVN